uniref:Glycoprotein vIgFam3 n=1 Tax=Elephant endotheliotropic herpesvirus 1A TaxID=759753 RepID=A0A499S2V1_ELHV1|nr:glycoprotein vIgFam3 [Elephant endotheliotropic herpesvirus 1A]QOE74639.1 glycoprotein vIgFam3 [Elephant endotheliotropic herpesvirus 1A]
MITYTKIWKAVICCFIAYIYLLSIDHQGVMTGKPSMVDKVVSAGGNVSLKLNGTQYISIAWLHNSSLIVLWEKNTTKSPRPNVHSQTPTCITITNAHVNDSGIYTALGFTNVGLSSTRFNLRVNTTTV